jgi:hypothetical protein
LQICNESNIIKVPKLTKKRKQEWRHVNVSFDPVPDPATTNQPITAPDAHWNGPDGILALFAEFLLFFSKETNYQIMISIKEGGIKYHDEFFVLDPFEENRNCAASMSKVGMKEIRRVFSREWKDLKKSY